MYELEEHRPAVAAQIDAIPQRAWNDYEAAVVFVLRHPFDGQLADDRARPRPKKRNFGLFPFSVGHTDRGSHHATR